MATFSENLVRHLFVGVESKAPTTKGAKVGAIKAMTDKAKEYLWFSYLGEGGLISSDKIKISNIVRTKATKSKDMEIPLNKYKVVLNDAVKPGQDYLLRVAFSQYVGMSDTDTYWKYGMVHAFKSMKADEFYKVLVNSLLINAMRDEMKLFKVYVHSAAKGASKKNTTTGTAFADGIMEVTKPIKNYTVSNNSNPFYVEGNTLVDDIDSILIEEVEQPWILGKVAAEKIPFIVQTDSIVIDGSEVLWGTITKETPTAKITNGKTIADLEYFCMGERGDIYRGMGWPNNIETKYLVDARHNYDVIDIDYFFAGNNEDVQKSQKTLTIVMDNAGSSALEKAIAGDINTVTGKPGLVEVFG